MIENIHIAPDASAAGKAVAKEIAQLVKNNPYAVLGLATGSTPVPVYRALIDIHLEGLSFRNVTCFNLDEYYPMQPDSEHSYHRFMQREFFDYIDCVNWHVPDGARADSATLDKRGAAYEAAIEKAGGIDYQLLGIGPNGHIGFNEPGSAVDSRTRLVELAPETRRAAADGFGGLGNVPLQAITMGLGTILKARKVVLMATGSAKADIIAWALTQAPTIHVPATLLQRHPNFTCHLDQAAAAKLPSPGGLASLSGLQRGGNTRGVALNTPP